MPILHPRRWLLPFVEGQLAPERHARVAAHLQTCGRCRRRVADLGRGLAAARALGPVSPPAAVDAAVAAAVAGAAAPGGRRRAVRTWRWAAAGLAAAVVTALWLGARANVELVTAPPSLGSLEALGLDAHRRLVAGQLPLDLRSDSPADLRDWLTQRGLSAALVVDRPAEDGDRFRPVGVAALDRPGRPMAAVVYAVDGVPVVLVTARQRDVPDAPRWSLGGKRVHHRDVAGAHLLTWSNSGKAYALVSELPRLGRDACLLCHADPRRRELIRSLAAPSPQS